MGHLETRSFVDLQKACKRVMSSKRSPLGGSSQLAARVPDQHAGLSKSRCLALNMTCAGAERAMRLDFEARWPVPPFSQACPISDLAAGAIFPLTCARAQSCFRSSSQWRALRITCKVDCSLVADPRRAKSPCWIHAYCGLTPGQVRMSAL